MHAHGDPQGTTADVGVSQWSKGGIKSQQKRTLCWPSSRNLLPLVRQREDIYTLWTAFLVAVLGLPRTHASIHRSLCDQRQASEGRVVRSRMPAETVNLLCLLSSWYRILCSWESQCQVHRLLWDVYRMSCLQSGYWSHSWYCLTLLPILSHCLVPSLVILSLFSLGILYVSSHLPIFLKSFSN